MELMRLERDKGADVRSRGGGGCRTIQVGSSVSVETRAHFNFIYYSTYSTSISVQYRQLFIVDPES